MVPSGVGQNFTGHVFLPNMSRDIWAPYMHCVGYSGLLEAKYAIGPHPEIVVSDMNL